MKYLGLDLGTRSLGVSISDKTKTIASFYENIKYSGDYQELLNRLDVILKNETIELIVLGWPKNMDNTVGERGIETEAFKKLLEDKYHIDVVLEDERLTTKLIESVLIDADLSRKKRKKVVDGLSAVVILQSFLDRKKEN